VDDGQHKQQLSSDEGRPRSRRHLASFAASLAAHAAIVGLLVCFASPLARRHSDWVLAYLIEVGDGAAGRGGASAAASAAPSIHAASAALDPTSASADQRARKPAAARKTRRRRLEDAQSELASLAPAFVRAVAPARPRDPAQPEPAAASAAAPGSRSGGGAADSVGAAAGASAPAAGSAAGGDGASDSLAHADYARNPPPAYPAVARRRGLQGTVTVRVLVGADGSIESADVADSSGSDALDDAALETVRSRWRFVPARHDGLAVESWVLVPIRFALVETSAVR